MKRAKLDRIVQRLKKAENVSCDRFGGAGEKMRQRNTFNRKTFSRNFFKLNNM